MNNPRVSQGLGGPTTSPKSLSPWKRKDGWRRFGLPLAGALILVLSFGAMFAIWNNVRDMETKRYQEHEALAQSISETAKTFLVNRQYDYFLEILNLIRKTSFIEHIEVMIDGRTVLQSGSIPNPDRTAGPRGQLTDWFPRTHKVRKLLDYQGGKQAELWITFSLEEFRKPQLYFLATFALIVVLLVCLGWAGYGLVLTHRKLVLAERTKEHMIYSITHDAKQDLSVIQGKLSSVVSKVKGGSVPVHLEKDLRLTMESADAIERYLNNLKDQQGLASGKVDIMHEPVRVHEIIDSVAEAFSEKMNIRNMTVKIGHLEKNGSVLGDAQMIKRVLMNLVHNAMKYSPEGGVVSLWQELGPRELSTFVRDQGSGIPRADWERIFEPYVQLDSKREGMGLGLATARSLAELLGGRLIVAESSLGRGTTMCLTLPLTPNERVRTREA